MIQSVENPITAPKVLCTFAFLFLQRANVAIDAMPLKPADLAKLTEDVRTFIFYNFAHRVPL